MLDFKVVPSTEIGDMDRCATVGELPKLLGRCRLQGLSFSMSG
jgi:hypothetical protein